MAWVRKTIVFCVIFLAVYAVFSEVEAYDECSYDYQCTSSFRKYCCKRKFPEDNVCRSNCIYESCILDSDCAPGECCDSDDKCTTGDCIRGLAGWIVAVIVISVIVVIAIPIAVVVFCCCCAAAAASGRPARGGVVVTQPATTGVAVVSSQQQQQQQYPAQPGQPMYYQPYPNQPYSPQANPSQPPPYQPYPTGASGAQIAMTPQTQVKQ